MVPSYRSVRFFHEYRWSYVVLTVVAVFGLVVQVGASGTWGTSTKHGKNVPPPPRNPDFRALPLRSEVAARTSLNPPLENAFYAHGGFMGCAPSMLANGKWVHILKTLAPEIYDFVNSGPHQAEKQYETKHLDSLMVEFENSPIGAAYGFESLRLAGKQGHLKVPFEWDVFLHPKATAENLRLDEMWIAHGTPAILASESAGINAYWPVYGLAPTSLGGVSLKTWRTLFAKSLEMARSSANDKQQDESNEVSWTRFFKAFRHDSPADTPIRVIIDIKTGPTAPGGVVTGRAPVETIKALVKALNDVGVFVEGVGSFNWKQLDGLESVTQSTLGQGSKAPAGVQLRPIMFYHGLFASSLKSVTGNQLIEAANRKEGPFSIKGGHVMFNGGFLIRYSSVEFGKAKTESMIIDSKAVDVLKAIKSLRDTHFGIYVQEYDIEAHALGLLNDLVNKERDLFDLGFAWGGFPDTFYKGLVSTLMNARVGTASQNVLSLVMSNAPGGEDDIRLIGSARSIMKRTSEFVDSVVDSAKSTAKQVTEAVANKVESVKQKGKEAWSKFVSNVKQRLSPK